MRMMPRRNSFGFGFDLFDEMFKDPFFSRTEGRSDVMKTDIKEKDGNYLMEIDLPGFAKEDINAELKDGYMTVTATKNESNDTKDEDGNYIHRERYSGSCSRTFYVGDGVTEEDIKASFKDGILHLSIPKEEPKKLEEQKKLISIE
ncbi:Hsp20/alpha crystallin family protein [Anaerovorax odorimutans]|uniref:Hsp20/alpha crystallin family protein n=1 Tax=Anaerovorax odorimutans TaxID=109327 RepID=A0ABT1RNH2_9FIRM|nr:Hsp20/alpha crystallin family protein [Anaerovorax odorimutans]MCQ4636476.1 Hsp20/alpha crystallin family protein [Anaerovorax odorimutans]